MKQPKHFIFVLCVVSLIFLPVMLEQGMFMDGLIYSCVARNLSDNFFCNNHLFLSSTFLANFHEQPPLVFYLQGLFIKIFGDSYFIDRIYSYTTLLFCLYFIYLIAKKFTVLKNHSGIAIVFFLFIPVVDWCFKNNMLENTMCIFTLLSVYISFEYYQSKSIRLPIFLILNAILIICAFLSKGFTGIFTLSFPLLYNIIILRNNIKWLYETTLNLVVTIITFILILILIPSLKIYLIEYLNTQVVASVSGNREVDGYFFIVKRIPQELLILIGITILLHIQYKKLIFHKILSKIKSNKQLLLFLCIALAGSLPIMVSPKQSGYYVLCSYPFFALFFAILNYDELIYYIKLFVSKMNGRLINYSLMTIVSICIILMLTNYGKYYRDEEKIKMIDQISILISQSKQLQISSDLENDYSLYGYFARRHRISLIKNYDNISNDFLLTNASSSSIKNLQIFHFNEQNYYLVK